MDVRLTWALCLAGCLLLVGCVSLPREATDPTAGAPQSTPASAPTQAPPSATPSTIAAPASTTPAPPMPAAASPAAVDATFAAAAERYAAELRVSGTRFVDVSQGIKAGTVSLAEGKRTLSEERARLESLREEAAALTPPPGQAGAHQDLLSAFDSAIRATQSAERCLDSDILACAEALRLQDETLRDVQAMERAAGLA